MRAAIGSEEWGLDCDHGDHAQNTPPQPPTVDVPDPEPEGFDFYDHLGNPVVLISREPPAPPFVFGFAGGAG